MTTGSTAKKEWDGRPSDAELDLLAAEMGWIRAYGIANRRREPRDADYRCRYCGAPCDDGRVCQAHSDIHTATVDTVEGVGQLSVDDVIALAEADAR